MKLTQDHFDLVASVLATLPRDADGFIKIHPHALSDRFGNAMARHASTADLNRFHLAAHPAPVADRCAGCGEPYPCSDSRRTDLRGDVRAQHVRAGV